jgi:hypothetical protein
MIQAVPNLTDPPPTELLKQLRTLRPEGVAYLPPVAPEST